MDDLIHLHYIPRTVAKQNNLKFYFEGKPCKKGHINLRYTTSYTCVTCEKQKVTPEYNESCSEYRKRTNYASSKKYTDNNREKHRERCKSWKQKNKILVNAYTGKRRKRLQQATPKWLTKEHHSQIIQFHVDRAKLTDSTGIEHEVDHIIPILGELVCGLNVPWNLQIITKIDNGRKNNNFSI